MGKAGPFEARQTFESAKHYFVSRGLKVTKDAVECTGAGHSFHSSPVHHALRYILAVFVMLLLLFMTGTIVGLLLWLGDMAEVWTENLVLQNSPILFYLLTIKVLQGFYDALAEKLTHTENHIIHGHYVRSLTIKTAFFRLLNNLGFFVYVAFWKQDLEYLRMQLLIFFTVKQVIGNAVEVGLPWARGVWHARRGKTTDSATGPDPTKQDLKALIEREWQKPDQEIGEDYLEVAVLFAVATWFAPVFPLGPLFAFMHAITEAWGDSYKQCRIMRRRVPEGKNEVVLEAWLDVFSMIGCFGIGISTALISMCQGGWNAHQLSIFEHMVLFVWLYLYLSIPREPEWLTQHKQNTEKLAFQQLLQQK